jgi:hypothetical protein
MRIPNSSRSSNIVIEPEPGIMTSGLPDVADCPCQFPKYAPPVCPKYSVGHRTDSPCERLNTTKHLLKRIRAALVGVFLGGYPIALTFS